MPSSFLYDLWRTFFPAYLKVLVLVNTDDGSTGNTEVVYVPYKMVAHWPSCLEPRGYKNNMEEEPQPYAREVVLSEA